MVRKEDLCDWFKGLPPHKRVDYMCGLLHMCHPLELRFTGTVVEDLAKKDFHFLRDQEIKANQRSDLASNNSNSLSDQKLRAKIITALALMNSTNLPCAEVIFEILQQQFDNLLGLLHNNSRNVADLIMILTMAVHHPAFTFYQKDRLGQVLERVEGHLRELYGEDDDERDLILQSQTLTPETVIQPNSLNNSQSPIPQSEKVTVVEIKVISAVPSQIKKGGAEYRIHTTWSNEEVTEVLLKFKQLQELHHKLLNRFPDEKKTHTFVPVFPGKYTHKEESLEVQISSLNTYFSKLSKAPAHILDCDILTEPLRSGTLVYQPKSASSTHPSPSATIQQLQTQDMLIQASPLREDRKYEFSPYRQPILMSYSGMVPHSICSPVGTLQMSSAANSPANSRNSSPVPLMPNPGGKSNSLPPGAVKVNSAAMPGIGVPQPVRSSDQIAQLLHVLNMDEYYDNLKEYPFQQIMLMGKEEFAKAGLPPEAQAKLKSRLDQAKPADFTNQVDPSRFQSAETSQTFYPPYCFHTHFPYMTPPFTPQFIHPTYAAQPGHISMMPSLHSHMQVSESSPANSEASSPPPSPLQPMAGLPLDHGQGHVVHQAQPMLESTFHAMSSPGAGDNSDGKSPRNVKVQQLDSSGSEEERATGYGMELRNIKNKGRARPQQSRSLPLINQGTISVSAMEAAKLTGMPISMSAPHSHPALMNAEPRTGNTPPLQAVSAVAVSHVSTNPTVAVVNGYISDPPPIQPHGAASIVPRAILNSRTYKTAQPAHTSLGVHKNIMNMPAPDISHSLSNMGKNGANPNSLPLLHGNLPPQSYNIGPSIAAVQPAHVMGLSPVNFPVNNTMQLGPQSSPTQQMMPEANSAYPMLMYGHPRGILTTMANSTAVMTTTQSHHTGPPMSHSPSPAAACSDQIQAASYVAEIIDPNRSDGSSHTPPVQTPVHVGVVKSHTNASGTNSSTPSPPLVPAISKQVGTNDTQPGGRGPQMFGFPNGFLQPIIYQHQPHFPNGIAPEFAGWMRLPQVSSNQYPIVYGGVFPHHNMHSTIHTAQGSSGPVAPTHQGNAGGAVSGKSRCYNCGLAGHKASECKEIRMENMSNTFHLSYKPSDPPA